VKTEQNPVYYAGDSFGFVINNVEAAELVLERGKKYSFKLNGMVDIGKFLT
jgi:hypothetical protein